MIHKELCFTDVNFLKKIRGTLNAFMFTRKLEYFFQNYVEH